jgi:hypothetical protein
MKDSGNTESSDVTPKPANAKSISSSESNKIPSFSNLLSKKCQRKIAKVAKKDPKKSRDNYTG